MKTNNKNVRLQQHVVLLNVMERAVQHNYSAYRYGGFIHYPGVKGDCGVYVVCLLLCESIKFLAYVALLLIYAFSEGIMY
jgi:hypothetical protein